MAEDQWHHLEGTYPQRGLFRLYFYDNFSKPIDASQFSGTFILLDDSFKEVASFPLGPSAGGETLDARIPPARASLPLSVAVRIAFAPSAKPQLFNFTFATLTGEKLAPAAAFLTPLHPTAGIAPAARWTSYRHTASPGRVPFSSSPVVFRAQTQAPRVVDSPVEMPAELAEALDETALPKTVPELIATLLSRLRELQDVIASGNLALAWLPAMATKTAALALDAHSGELPVSRRARAAGAARGVIAGAWEIDAYGDLGNLSAVSAAAQRLTEAVGELREMYAAAP